MVEALVTVITELPTKLPSTVVAVIVVVPGRLPVTSPAPLTLAIAALLEAQVAAELDELVGQTEAANLTVPFNGYRIRDWSNCNVGYKYPGIHVGHAAPN